MKEGLAILAGRRGGNVCRVIDFELIGKRRSCPRRLRPQSKYKAYIAAEEMPCHEAVKA
jgi:hypothetical protein